MGTVRRILTYDEALSVQRALNAHGAKLLEDGHFGQLSQLALIRFQHTNGLPETGEPDLVTCSALGIPAITTPAPAPPPKLTPNPVVQGLVGFIANYVINNLILKGTGINMDLAKISKAIAGGLSGAGIGGAGAAYTYISLPPAAQDVLPHWVPVAIPIANMVIGFVVGFSVVYFAPANKPA